MNIATARIVLVAAPLMAATMFFVPQVSHAEDTPVSEPPRVERPTPAWTAARNAEAEREKPPDFEDSSPPQKSYRLELTGAYVAAPVVAFGFSALFVLGTDFGPGYAIAGAILGVAIPATVHLLNGEVGRAALSFFVMPVIVVGSAFVFGLLGLATYRLFEGDVEDPDESFNSGFTAATIGLWIGGALAFITYASVDVIQSGGPSKSRSRTSSNLTLRVAVAPRPDGAAAVLGGRF
jgi:hypothetical protein